MQLIHEARLTKHHADETSQHPAMSITSMGHSDEVLSCSWLYHTVLCMPSDTWCPCIQHKEQLLLVWVLHPGTRADLVPTDCLHTHSAHTHSALRSVTNIPFAVLSLPLLTPRGPLWGTG